MVKSQTREVEILKFDIKVTEQHISDGKCRLAFKCMEKVAIAEALIKLGLGKSDADLRVRVDAGHIKFNAMGYHWLADTPRIAKKSLILFDRKLPVKEHSYKLVARRLGKIAKTSRSRQIQVNEARRKRIQRKGNDPHYNPIRKRIIGFTG